MSHTKGPWVAFHSLNLILTPDENGSQFEICSIKKSGFQAVKSLKEREANLDLIAAAPDMLGQLEAIVEGFDFGDSPDDYADLHIYKMVSSVKEVIKKAKGEL